MKRRKLVMTGVVAGSIALGGVLGATVFTPAVGLAASDTETGERLATVCAAGIVREDVIGVAAETIGIEPSVLLEAVRDGQTIAEVAEANGVEPSLVVDAIVAAHRERLDQAVGDGALTQEEADEMAAALEERVTAFVEGELVRSPLVGHPGLWGFADGPVAAAADVIGIGPVELLEAIRDGQTIAEVAEANGVDASAVIDAVVAALQERLDSAVENGWIREQEADERAADLEEQATAIVDGDLPPLPFAGPWLGRGPLGPPIGSGDTDGTSTAEASLF
jgi:uncharacterized protein (DUF433 family)